MEKEKQLTKEDITKVSLGYKWDPEMSYETFAKINVNLSRSEAFNVYDIINLRYINLRYN